jgi:hypothetical protein
MPGFRLFDTFFAVPLLIAASVWCGAAQSETAAVRGRVLDPANAPIAGARITALPGDGRPGGPEVLSNRDGEFSLSLAAGNYTLGISADGFTSAQEAVVVPLRASRQLDLVLAVASRHETVTVSETVGYRTAALSSSTKTLSLL